MTVGELIEKLKEFPSDLDVTIDTGVLLADVDEIYRDRYAIPQALVIVAVSEDM